MAVKPAVEAIALNTQSLSNENDIRDSPLGKLAPETSSIYVPKQYRSKRIFSGHTVQPTLLNESLRIHIQCLCSYWWSIGKYSYTGLGNIMIGVWNIGREVPRRMKHDYFFNTWMSEFEYAVFSANCFSQLNNVCITN